MSKKVRLYLIEAIRTEFGQTDNAVVLAYDEEHAREIFDQAMVRTDAPGYWTKKARSGYEISELPMVPGPVLAEGQDG